MIIERQVMAENKSEFVFASCQLVNVWAQKMGQEERVMFVTEVRIGDTIMYHNTATFQKMNRKKWRYYGRTLSCFPPSKKLFSC